MSIISILTFARKQHEHDDVYTFYFSTGNKLKHKAGQHGLFLLLGLYRPHPFSLSSSPDEGRVAFTTHTTTGSRYKQKIMSMKNGEKVILLGPILNFTFKKNERTYVLLAQGVGITPFRSMLAYAHSQNLPVTTTLIHVDSKEHTFRKQTSTYATHAYYPTSADEFRELLKLQDRNQLFYLSGSPRFVSETKQLLLSLGVNARSMKTDSFLGY